jgi:DNA invertase Pin-like site-specific DNA recombinase
MTKRCAIYVRVSSDLQDYERQIQELKAYAKNNNFELQDEHIYEDKLSGFKNENERLGLNSLFKDIVKYDIKIVLIWELSRLARRQKYLLDYQDFFLQHSINVYFLQQNFWLLDENFKVSQQAGIFISVLGYFSEYEALLMKERFLSAKRLNETTGRYNGGKIPFGYTLDENNSYIIDTELVPGLDVSSSDIVKEMFLLYSQGLTASKVCRISRSKGYPKCVLFTHTLARLLRNTTYIGSKNVKLGDRKTPQIIPNYLFDEVQKLLDTNKTRGDKERKHIHLLRGLLKCSYCGQYYLGQQTTDAYICAQNTHSNKINKNTICKGGGISACNIDGIIWSLVRDIILFREPEDFASVNNTHQSNLDELERMILNFNGSLEELEKKRKRKNMMFENGGITDKEYLVYIKTYQNEKNAILRDINNLEAKIKVLETEIENSEKFLPRKERFDQISDRASMKEIIKSVIKEITFVKVKNHRMAVTVKYHSFDKEIIVYNSLSRKGNTYKKIDARYLKYNPTNEKFYLLKDRNLPQHIFRAKSEILKTMGIKIELPDFIPISTFKWQLLINNLPEIDVDDYLHPVPDDSNSDLFSFDEIMDISYIPSDILVTLNYEKITYFKDLNFERFNRRKATKKSLKN